jgi:hypothetical protein
VTGCGETLATRESAALIKRQGRDWKEMRRVLKAARKEEEREEYA